MSAITQVKYTGQSSSNSRQVLIQELQENRQKYYPHLANLFDQLNSSDEQMVRKAEEEIKDLQDQNITFHTMVLHSFPLWPIDESALKQIAFDQSESKHPQLRERAFIACDYLVTNRCLEGRPAAASIAAKKMRSENEALQEEGFNYFALLLNQWRPELPQEDLTLAISIAKKVCMTERWVTANHFFENLIKKGQKCDLVQLKNTTLDLCASNNFHAFFVGRGICKTLVTNHSKCKDLIEIPLQAAISMCACASEDQFTRTQGLDLFWLLLSWSPESTMDPLLEALEIESKRNDPQIGLLQRLNEIAGHDFFNLFCAKETIEKRAEQDAPKLLQILTNLSTCKSPYFQQQAESLKQVVVARMAAKL